MKPDVGSWCQQGSTQLCFCKNLCRAGVGAGLGLLGCETLGRSSLCGLVIGIITDLSSQQIDCKDRPRQLLTRTCRKLILSHLVLTQPYLDTSAGVGGSGWSLTGRNSNLPSLISLVEAPCCAWVTEVMLRHVTCLQRLPDQHWTWNLLEKAAWMSGSLPVS